MYIYEPLSSTDVGPGEAEEMLRHDHLTIQLQLVIARRRCRRRNRHRRRKGSASDAQIYNQSELKEVLEAGTLGLPHPDPLSDDNEPVPYYFIGDDAFGLKGHLLKPYALRGLTHDERIFNYYIDCPEPEE